MLEWERECVCLQTRVCACVLKAAPQPPGLGVVGAAGSLPLRVTQQADPTLSSFGLTGAAGEHQTSGHGAQGSTTVSFSPLYGDG